MIDTLAQLTYEYLFSYQCIGLKRAIQTTLRRKLNCSSYYNEDETFKLIRNLVENWFLNKFGQGKFYYKRPVIRTPDKINEYWVSHEVDACLYTVYGIDNPSYSSFMINVKIHDNNNTYECDYHFSTALLKQFGIPKTYKEFVESQKLLEL